MHLIGRVEAVTDPQFTMDASMKYLKETMGGKADKTKKYIAELKKEKMTKKELKENIDKMSAFDVSLFGFKLESKNISAANYDTKSVNEKVKEDDLIFTECIYQVTDILNHKFGSKINVYKLEGKYYLNYTEGLSYLNSLINGKEMDFDVIELSQKAK